jgi:hypothetical protein
LSGSWLVLCENHKADEAMIPVNITVSGSANTKLDSDVISDVLRELHMRLDKDGFTSDWIKRDYSSRSGDSGTNTLAVAASARDSRFIRLALFVFFWMFYKKLDTPIKMLYCQFSLKAIE